jgi:predicted enzyme related to lactoylglutathione lyase
VFTTDVVRVAAFYENVIVMQVQKSAADHIRLEKGLFLLTVHATPEPYTRGITITTPPAVRESTAIKLSFRVVSIADARETAARLGGCLHGSDREWRDRPKTLCDGWDPDGNVFQVFTIREP